MFRKQFVYLLLLGFTGADLAWDGFGGGRAGARGNFGFERVVGVWAVGVSNRKP